MYKITYRPFEPGDFEPVAELMRAQWSCDMADEAGVYSSAIDLCGYLAQTDWSLVAAREDGEVIGAALLRLNDNRSTTWEKRRAALASEVSSDPDLEAEVRRDVDMLEEEARLSEEYGASGRLGSKAELKLLIVSPRAQGLGVGGRLFAAASEAASKNGGLYLLTDDACDIGFYDHKGMQRMVSRPSEVEDPACPQTADASDGNAFNLYVYAQGPVR